MKRNTESRKKVKILDLGLREVNLMNYPNIQYCWMWCIHFICSTSQREC